VKRVISLVDRHQSNGVEGTNKQIVRHLRTLVHDLRVPKKWSDPTILSLVLFVINDAVNSETGVRPLDAKFGSADGIYFRLPENSSPSEITNAWVRALDVDLQHTRAVSLEYQKSLWLSVPRILPNSCKIVTSPVISFYISATQMLHYQLSYRPRMQDHMRLFSSTRMMSSADIWSWGMLPVCM